MGRCLRPKMLAHVGQQLQHLVLADATLRDLSALSGIRATGVYREYRGYMGLKHGTALQVMGRGLCNWCHGLH